MKKIILTLLSLSVIGSASTVAAQDFNIAAKHAIAVEANTGKITVTTKNTGASTNPVFTLTPNQANSESPITWKCKYKGGEAKHVPANCRDKEAS